MGPIPMPSTTFLPPSFLYSLITFSWPLWSLLTQCLFLPSPGGPLVPPGSTRLSKATQYSFYHIFSYSVLCSTPGVGVQKKQIRTVIHTQKWLIDTPPSLCLSGYLLAKQIHSQVMECAWKCLDTEPHGTEHSQRSRSGRNINGPQTLGCPPPGPLPYFLPLTTPCHSLISICSILALHWKGASSTVGKKATL